MQEISQKIYTSGDWFEYTIACPNHIQDWPILTSEQDVIFKTCFPYRHNDNLELIKREAHDPTAKMHGYSQVKDFGYCSVNVNPNLRSQKIGVRFNGDGLRMWRDMGESEHELFSFAKSARANPTRIDIAFDLVGWGIDPIEVYNDWCTGKFATTARTAQPVTKAQKIDGVLTTASTLYIGSRESEVMIRLYEKGKKENMPIDWVRLELEIKGDKAVAILPELVRLDIAQVGTQILRDFVTKPRYKFMRELLKGDITPLAPVMRKESDTDAWFRNVIYPLIERRIQLEFETPTAYSLQTDLEGLISNAWHNRADVLRKQYGRNNENIV